MSAPRSSSANTTWIDVSVPVRSGMVHWPDNPPIELVRTMDMAKGAPANVSHLSLGVHSGTHVDAPVHFLADGGGVDAIPLDRLLGDARVVEFDDRLTARDGLVVVVGHEQFFRTYLLGRTNDFTYTLADMSGIGDNTYPPRIPNGHIHRIETTAPSTTARRRAQATTHGWPVAPTRSTRRRQQ